MPRSLSASATRLAERLFPEDQPQSSAFLQALTQPQRDGHAIAWLRERQPVPFPVSEPSAWQPDWVDRIAGDSGAGRHPLHEEGAYYCLDSSSVFAASVLSVVPPRPELVIDVCAAPGGKSLLAWRQLQPQHLLANEVVGKRVPPLLQNLRRCHVTPATVCSADPAALAEKLPEQAEVVLVDAPCSGQSLIAKGKDAPGCFHPSIVSMNAQRQRRILSAALALVAPGGHLAYFTCTYAEKENESNLTWLLKRFPQFTAVPVPRLSAYQSKLSEQPCYRLWPQQGEGAGAFTALLQRSGDRKPKALPDFSALLERTWRVE